jgi:hypothetical protein
MDLQGIPSGYLTRFETHRVENQGKVTWFGISVTDKTNLTRWFTLTREQSQSKQERMKQTAS